MYPNENEPDRRTFFGQTGRSIATTSLLSGAFDAAEERAAALMMRNCGAGLTKSLLHGRICERPGLSPRVTKIAGHYGLAPDEFNTASDAPGQVTDEDHTALNYHIFASV